MMAARAGARGLLRGRLRAARSSHVMRARDGATSPGRMGASSPSVPGSTACAARARRSRRPQSSIGSRFWDEGLLPAIRRARRTHLARGMPPAALPDRRVCPRAHEPRSRARAVARLLEEEAPPPARPRHLRAASALEQGGRRHLAPDNIALRGTASFLAPARQVLALDLRRASSLPERVTTSFRLARGGGSPVSARSCASTSIAARWFSTGPDRMGTHWGQPAFRPLSNPSSLAAARACASRCPWPSARRLALDLRSRSAPAPGLHRQPPIFIASPVARRRPAAGPPASAVPARARWRPG